MFDRLVASKPARPRLVSHLPVIAASIFAHGGAVLGGIHWTAREPHDVPAAARSDTIPIQFPAMERRQPAIPEESRTTILRPRLPRGFQVTVPPSVIPDGTPPIDAEADFDPRNYTGIGVPGGVFDVIPDLAPGRLATGFAFLVTDLDDPPERISSPPLRYPDLLRRAGIEGERPPYLRPRTYYVYFSQSDQGPSGGLYNLTSRQADVAIDRLHQKREATFDELVGDMPVAGYAWQREDIQYASRPNFSF